MGSKNYLEFYFGLISHWQDPTSLVYDSSELKTAFLNREYSTKEDIVNAMLLDLKPTYQTIFCAKLTEPPCLIHWKLECHFWIKK